jgi:tRNA/tmRNA/rRNA uracil-C5-methylase (TrmA/RlmC/RlmD family)
MASNKSSALKVGDLIEVSIEKVAHGGHFIARHNGAVIFVRHAIPEEKCIVEITSTGSSFNRGDVVEVINQSEHRVIAPCVFAHRAGCGGCDFQHIDPLYQRILKSDVIKEQFERIAKRILKLKLKRSVIHLDGVPVPLQLQTQTENWDSTNQDLIRLFRLQIVLFVLIL